MQDVVACADRPQDECGVFGIYDYLDAAAITALGLHALQHRGQEAAGIVSFDGEQFYAERRSGLVGDSFTDPSVITGLSGNHAIGHVRYSTSGASISRNIQPLFSDIATGGFSICHNGNITNALKIRQTLVKEGAIFQSTSDTEVIMQLVAKSSRSKMIERLVEALFQIEGAYSLVILTNKKLIAARDPNGIRPLLVGNLASKYIFASETCALDMVGASFVREVEPGEICIVTENGLESVKPFANTQNRPCIFEYIYFARPDSVIRNHSVYEYRSRMGAILAEETPTVADIVSPIPDSGVPAAIGFAKAANLPFEHSIIRNHYVGRTFIEPKQNIRSFSVKLKHNPVRSLIEGKRVVLVDDSIVRGTTAAKIVKMVRDAGALEVHLRISAPPIKFPDFYGIDTPDSQELLAATKSRREMEEFIGCDTLGFLSIDGLYRAIGYPGGRNDDDPQLTDHCFTGDYPTFLTDYNAIDSPKQLSFLHEKAQN